MDKSLFERVLYSLTTTNNGSLVEGKKSQTFVFVDGEYTHNYAVWGSKLYYETKVGEEIFCQGFVRLDDIVKATFSSLTSACSYLLLEDINRIKYPILFPYIKDPHSLNVIFSEECTKPTVDKENENGRKITLYISNQTDLLSGKGAWCFIVCEKNEELFKSFNLESTTNEQKLTFMALIAAIKMLGAVNPSSVSVVSDCDYVVTNRQKGQTIQKYSEKGSMLPSSVSFCDYWNFIIEQEKSFSFRFVYTKPEKDDMFIANCRHECDTILASNVLSTIGA